MNTRASIAGHLPQQNLDADQVAGGLLDSAEVGRLVGDTIALGLGTHAADGQLRFALAANERVPLRRMLPALQSMDLEVLHEHTVFWRREDESPCHVYELILQAGSDAVAGLLHPGADSEKAIRDTFLAIWTGRAEADSFNALVLRAGLSWQEVSVLRSYSRYLRQLPLPYSHGRVARVLLDNPVATRALVALFRARFAETGRPAGDADRQRDIAAAEADLSQQIESVVHIDADRILRAYRSVITATVRTNAFAPESFTAAVPYLVYKLSAQTIDELPQPRPLSEIFVYSPEFEGLHLRFGLVARGGLRWSDRHDDYRTEVLGLVKAQAVKNAVIAPVGAKGVFVVKPAPGSPAEGQPDPNQTRTHALRCYKQFMSALLDVVDSTPETPRPTCGIVCHDGADPYLVVAADKGTATFSDSANAVAMGRGFWLGDAFASGGSSGYDHKAMGITARGAWVSGDMHLKELGICSETDAFSVVGIGDMSGDVFGNGMLLRRGIRLVAAFDHRHIFIDPQPSGEPSHRERRRLFELARSSWDDYDRTLISTGGGVWPRTAKSIAVSAQMRDALAIAEQVSSLTPNELISHLLRAPVDVLFNGGVGTYVKASAEQHATVGDKVNDGVRVDADQVRARVVIEGGNLGVSARGRIEYARRGGHINTDAIDNAAGVDCSDHEVNIKILIDTAGRSNADERSARNRLLADLTDQVAEHVLANNRAHNRLLSDARFSAVQMIGVHARMTAALELRRDLHRGREHLPTDAEFAELAKSGQGLTTPQLATLLAHVKMDLKSELLAEDAFDDPFFDATMAQYFPAELRNRINASISEHPLRREIIATATVNRVLATSGLTYAFRLAEETGCTTSDVVRAHAIVSAVFDLDTLWADIYRAELPPALTNALIVEGRRLLDRASRWFLLNRPQELRIDVETQRFTQLVAELRQHLGTMLRGNELAAVDRAQRDLAEQGVPAAIARSISESLYAFSLLDVVEIALVNSEDVAGLARIYFELSDHLGVDSVLLAVSTLPRGGRWHALARVALREDLYRSLRDLALDVSKHVSSPIDPAVAIADFESYHRSQFERARSTLQEFVAIENPDLAVLSVATAQLRRLTSA